MAGSSYLYQPSTAAAGVACVIFSTNALLALFQAFRKKAWIWLVMVLALLMECIGFVTRIESAADTTDRNSYIVQFLLIMLAPVFMAGVIYVVFGRIVFYVIPAESRTMRLLWLPPRWVTPIFVTFDVIALFLQAIGAVMVASAEPTDTNGQENLNRGKTLALAGISVQVAAFGLFSVVAARFHLTSKPFAVALNSKLRRVEEGNTTMLEGSTKKIRPNWRVILFVINASCLFILIRSIYRIVEFTEGKTGYIAQYEWVMYVFDALPMSLVGVLYNIFPPSSYIPHMGLRVPKSKAADGVAESEYQLAARDSVV